MKSRTVLKGLTFMLGMLGLVISAPSFGHGGGHGGHGGGHGGGHHGGAHHAGGHHADRHNHNAAHRDGNRRNTVNHNVNHRNVVTRNYHNTNVNRVNVRNVNRGGYYRNGVWVAGTPAVVAPGVVSGVNNCIRPICTYRYNAQGLRYRACTNQRVC